MRVVDTLLTFTYGLLILAAVLWVASCRLHAQERDHKAAIAIIATSSVDLGTTLWDLHTLPGGHEANPALAHGGTAGLIAVKAGATAAIVLMVEKLMPLHPRLARITGYSISGLFAGAAWHNVRVR